jgi:hypothetical protein
MYAEGDNHLFIPLNQLFHYVSIKGELPNTDTHSIKCFFFFKKKIALIKEFKKYF